MTAAVILKICKKLTGEMKDFVLKILELSYGFVLKCFYEFRADYGFYVRKGQRYCVHCLNDIPPKAVPLPKEKSTCTYLKCPSCHNICKNPDYVERKTKRKNYFY